MSRFSYSFITRFAESEITATMDMASRATGEQERVAYERQAIGVYYFWQQLTGSAKTSADDLRLAGYLVGSPMPRAGE